jgi:nitrogen-specific signal transduction histidine kinase
MNNLIENSSINTLLTIMDNINNGAIIVDDNYNVMYANKTSEVLLNNEYNNQAISKLLNDGKVNFSLKRALSGKTLRANYLPHR